MSNSKNKAKRRPWPEKRRKNQADNIRKTRPWKHATGPRTAAGKETVRNNATKTGYYSADMHALRRALNAQKAYIRRVRAALGD